jgi:hypothetical protein
MVIIEAQLAEYGHGCAGQAHGCGVPPLEVTSIPPTLLTPSHDTHLLYTEHTFFMSYQTSKMTYTPSSPAPPPTPPPGSETSEEDASGDSSWDEYEEVILGQVHA